MDRLSPEQRSRLMSRIKGKDTKPEIVVRKLLTSMGYRYRLHRKDLPGTPDIVFPGRKKVIFVSGCYWHRHPSCSRASTPSTRKDFWEAKFNANVNRDRSNIAELQRQGWDVLTIWECEIKQPENLHSILTTFLSTRIGASR